MNKIDSMSAPSKSLSSLHPDIEVFINGAVFSQKDLILSILSHRIPFTQNAKKVIKDYKHFFQSLPEIDGPEVKLCIKPYEGSNAYVQKMVNYLEIHLRDDLVGAYVHGSLGTYEEISYSDFDALVIIKDEVFQSAKRLIEVADKLSSARSIMYDFDLLQHHGWFVLAESEMWFYPDYYFPIELFKYAKSLFPDKGLELSVKKQGNSEKNQEQFLQLSNNIIKKLQSRDYPKNMYQLKCLLSVFMLLPALYIQVRDNKGIYKKFSYNAAKEDFSEEEWAIMDKVSDIRKNWSLKISHLKHHFLKSSRPLWRYFIKKYGPGIPVELNNILSIDFYESICRLTIILQRRFQ